MDDIKKDEDELDRFLTSALDEPPLPDAGFASGVSERLRRHRRRRRWAVGAALSSGTVVTMLGLYFSPPGFDAASTASPQAVALALVLAALCSLVWIGTESRTRPVIRKAGGAR
jgi:hypothetical protein